MTNEEEWLKSMAQGLASHNAQQEGYTLQAGERRVPDLIWSWADAAAGRTQAACEEKLSLPGKHRCSVPGNVDEAIGPMCFYRGCHTDSPAKKQP